MKRKTTLAAAALLVAAAAVATIMISRHSSTAVAPIQQQRAQVADAQLEQQIADAIRQANVSVRSLVVRKVGDIVVLRGTGDISAAQAAARIAKSLGVARVANLISPAAAVDDDAIRRDAERTIAQTRALDGCRIAVKCENGILSVSGTVQRELQKDAARQVLRSVSGAKEVRVDLTTL
jgi:osmotically-inducible protein OsmY